MYVRYADAFQSLPFPESRYPLYILRLPAAADFKTSVPLFRAAPHRWVVFARWFGKRLTPPTELRLIIFDSQHIVSAFSDYGRRRNFRRVGSLQSQPSPTASSPEDQEVPEPLEFHCFLLRTCKLREEFFSQRPGADDVGCFPGRVSGSPAGLSINRNDMPGHDIPIFR